MMDVETREYWKDECIRKEEEPGLEEVVTTVLNIYQTETGHWIEDEEAHSELIDDISARAARHSVEIKDNEKLVDKILEEMATDTTPEQVLN